MAKERIRYGIAEWYGEDVAQMTPERRRERAATALSIKDAVEGAPGAPLCPFQQSLIEGAKCNKPGGVCSIRRYVQTEDGNAVGAVNQHAVTTCPNRFLQSSAEDESVFSWIGQALFDAPHPFLIKEVPFLRKRQRDDSAAVRDDKAGRIDWVLVPELPQDPQKIELVAIETQAVYFSGANIWDDLRDYLQNPGQVRFPIGQRRPDYRSSGPKRLSPQLDAKVPVMRRWGTKVVVVVDRYFYEEMSTLPQVGPSNADDRERFDNAEVIWFIVRFTDDMRLVPDQIIYASLESSRDALQGTDPVNRSEFNHSLYTTLKTARTNKVFKI